MRALWNLVVSPITLFRSAGCIGKLGLAFVYLLMLGLCLGVALALIPPPAIEEMGIAAADPTSAPARVPCLIQSEDFVEEAQSILIAWDDGVALAKSTPRIALASQIARLQELRREVLALEVPSCTAGIKDRMAEFMDYTIKGFLAFMEQDQREWSDQYIQEWFQKARQSQLVLTEEVKALTSE